MKTLLKLCSYFLLVLTINIFITSCGTDYEYDKYLLLSDSLLTNKFGKWSYESNRNELAYELLHTHKLCDVYKIDYPTMLAIRYVEAKGRQIKKSIDYKTTKSYGAYQQTKLNTKQYGKGKSHKEISENVYINIEQACIYMKDIRNTVPGYNRQIIAFNTGIKGAKKLTYNEVLENQYLALVLANRKKMVRFLLACGISYNEYTD